METLNISRLLRLRRDRYATNQGPFVLADDSFDYIGAGLPLWQWMRQLGGLQFRVAYLCKNGKRRDWVGRQGVWNSIQDGKVSGEGHAQASQDNRTISFWTCIFDDEGNELTGEALKLYCELHPNKVNTGAGLGYRTIRTDTILAVAIERDGFEHHVTDIGWELITYARGC